MARRKAPFERPASGMGRRSDDPSEFDLSTPLHIQMIRPVDGDYDAGGAYWGFGPGSNPMFCVWDDEGHEFYMRAPQGIMQVMAKFPGAAWDHRRSPQRRRRR